MFKWSLIIIFLGMCYCSTPSSQCTNYTLLLKPRMFESIIDFQSNRQPFFYGNIHYGGNHVQFHDNNMTIIERNALISYDSRHIEKISLNGKQIKQIEDDAFYGLYCLMILDLRDNNISAIRKEMFKGLEFLHELYLGHNRLEVIPERVFRHTPFLKILCLAMNNLQVLNSDSFSLLVQLQYLYLSNNRLQTISPETMHHVQGLQELQLGSNQIDDLNLHQWKNMASLTVLNVSDNLLESFDMSVKYSFGQSLKKLYLSKNYLTTLFLKHVKSRFPALDLVDIDDNLWTCTELEKIIGELDSSGIIVHTGNSTTLPNVNNIACDRSKRGKPSQDALKSTEVVVNSTMKHLTAYERYPTNCTLDILGFIFICFLVISTCFIAVLRLRLFVCWRRDEDYVGVIDL